MELFLFYKISFLVAFISSSGLAVSGFHLVSRSMILSIFLLSQLALLGHMLATVFFHESLVASLITSVIFYFSGDYFLRKKNKHFSERNRLIIAGYVLVTALQYLLISLFPALDSHVNAGFFGNMVTTTDGENFFAISLFVLFSIVYFISRKAINKETFDLAVLSIKPKSTNLHYILSIPTVISLFLFGFLYTLGFLLIPSVILAKSFNTQLKSLLWIAFVSALSSVFGLALSIQFDRVPTTPAQIVALMILALLALGIKKLLLFR